jgi:hypothetical protein
VSEIISEGDTKLNKSIYFIKYKNLKNKAQEYSIFPKVYVQEKSAKKRLAKLVKSGSDAYLFKVDQSNWGEPLHIEDGVLSDSDINAAKKIGDWSSNGAAHRVVAGIFTELGKNDNLVSLMDNQVFVSVVTAIDSFPDRVKSWIKH